MKTEPVEIYSDRTNAAVIRHPDRQFPGVLLQGDTLHSLCADIDRALRAMDPGSEAFDELTSVRDRLWSLKTHYAATLTAHGLSRPFHEE